MDRRSFVKLAGSGGIVALAGCAGNGDTDEDDNGDLELNLATAAQGTSSQAAGAALSRAAAEHSDQLSISTTLTGGWAANPYLYDNDETEAIATDTYTAANAVNGREAFADDPVSKLPGQGIHFSASQIYLVAVDGSGVRSTEDISTEHNVYPTQPGFGSRMVTEEVFEAAGLADRIDGYVNVDVSDAAGAIEEDQIDVLAVYGGNSKSLPGWVVEVDARSDVHLVELEDSLLDAIGNVEGIRSETLTPDDHGWDQDITTDIADEIITWTQDGRWWFGPDVEPEAAYELCRISHEHLDFIQEADAEYPDHDDVDAMTFGMFDDLPVHEGVAEFLQDHDAWDDSWDIGNEYEV